MPELLVHTADGEHRLPFEGNPLVYDLIAHLPDAPVRSCAGTGRCGSCAVLAAGHFVPDVRSDGKILSCQSCLTGDAQIWLPKRRRIAQIETGGQADAFELNPVEGEYAVAVDLGTTTVVLELVRLKDGCTLSTVSCENPQRIVAADVIGRIDHALKGQLGLLQTLIADCIDTLENEAFDRAGMSGCRADIRIVAGNTTMLYLYTGRDPRTLAAAPFEADCLFGFASKRDFLPRCAGAFVGADITCALLSSGICRGDETALLIDIGTNGEIALWHKQKLVCCATAAGPAFEGSGISCGTGSVPGAIDSAALVNGRLNFTTIGQSSACGICGSGLIDLTAAMLDDETLDETGFLEDAVDIAPGVSLTQQDVRQIQLAKAAIAAGIQTLLHRCGLNESDVGTLCIAGGFGSHLNLQNAARIGLIPASLVNRTRILGNASLTGARRLLLSKTAHREAETIARCAECINLAADPFFSNTCVESMLF